MRERERGIERERERDTHTHTHKDTSCGMEDDFVEDSLFAQERFDSGSLRGRCLKCDHFARHLCQRAQFVPCVYDDMYIQIGCNSGYGAAANSRIDTIGLFCKSAQ